MRVRSAKSLGRRRRASALVGRSLAIASLLFTLACHSVPAPKPGQATPAMHTLPPKPVSGAQFSQEVHRLLLSGTPTPQRSSALVGVVRRQLIHAGELFDQGEAVRGANAVVGAFNLLGIGDLRPDLIDATSAAALRGAVARFSARGDEGRALALMMALEGLYPKGSPEAEQLAEHLRSLRRWIDDTHSGGDMLRLAADQKTAVGRALLEPSPEAMADAASAVDRWIERAVAYNIAFQQTKELPPRKEQGEAYRALQSGAETLSALFLRFGRADRAVAALERSEARKVVTPAFFLRLRAAAIHDSAEDWRDLARDFARLAFGDDTELDKQLGEAALWGTTVEAYRRGPEHRGIAHLLADQLILSEMAEVAPLVLHRSLGKTASPEALSAALSTVGDALSLQAGLASVDPARRIFAAAGPLLARADAPAYRRRLRPAPTELRQLMASIELRFGHAEAALGHLRSALRAEPTVFGHTLVASLQRQVGNHQAALEALQKAASLPLARRASIDLAEAKLLEFELLRERGAGGARAALDDALRLALASRNRGLSPANRVRAERTLGRVLDRYGERGRARDAFRRAIDAAGKDRRMLAETLLATIGRALVYSDRETAHAALRLGVEARIEEDELVYGALWLHLMERRAGIKDGYAARVLAGVDEASPWPAALALWARGRASDAELRAKASSYAQKVEAEFYIAMQARNDGKSGDEQLRKIASDPLVNSMEVRIARDLLAPKTGTPLPPAVRLP